MSHLTAAPPRLLRGARLPMAPRFLADHGRRFAICLFCSWHHAILFFFLRVAQENSTHLPPSFSQAFLVWSLGELQGNKQPASSNNTNNNMNRRSAPPTPPALRRHSPWSPSCTREKWRLGPVGSVGANLTYSLAIEQCCDCRTFHG